MANIRLAHEGYATLELNQVAFRRDGRIEAQCALNATDFGTNPAENGMLLVADQRVHEIKLPAEGAKNVLLHYSTEHIYDERTPGLNNWCLKPDEFYPRLGYLATGDKFTTNCVTYDNETWSTVSAFAASCNASDAALYGVAHSDGTILVTSVSTSAILQVIGAPEMPDGEQGVKFIAL